MAPASAGSPSIPLSVAGQRDREPSSFEGEMNMNAEATRRILRTEGLSKFSPALRRWITSILACGAAKSWRCWAKTARVNPLIKALTGVYHADRGTIWLEGQEISPKNTAHAQQLGIGTVYQEVNLLPNMSVADNLFIGREPRRFGLLRRKEMEKRATALISYGFPSTSANR
jgi:simple sugar transport system ATP-binding protein